MSGDDWLSDHLLGEETGSDAAEARRRLDADPLLRERAARLADVAARLDDLSPAAWEVATGTEEPAERWAQAPDPPRRRLGSPALALLLAVAALAVGVGIGALLWSGGGGGSSYVRGDDPSSSFSSSTAAPQVVFGTSSP